MIGKFIVDLFKKEEPFRVKVKTLVSYLKYYNNLSSGLRSEEIYHKKESQNKKFSDMLNGFDQTDWQLIKTFRKENIVKFLQKNNLRQDLNFDKKIGFEQVGINTIFVGKPVVGLWTTGKASFFLPTKKNYINKIAIEITIIPPSNVGIGFEGNILKTIKIPKLTTKTIQMEILPKKISETVSEIFITTDILWYPKTIFETTDSILVGVKVNKIKISYENTG